MPQNSATKHSIALGMLFVSVFVGTLHAQKTPRSPTLPPTDEIVKMDAFEVSAAKYQWRYATSPNFEILSCVNDTKLVTLIIQRADQIIETFQKNCPLFRPKNNRPVRLIFINDRSVERFLTFTGKDALQTARDRPPVGVEESSQRKNHVRQISARGYYDDEQIILLKLIPQNYLDGATPFEERVRENALDLAINYLLVCADTHIQPGNAPWLTATLNSMRGHGAGAAWRLPDNFESATYGLAGNVFQRPAWFTISDEHMTVGRYCLACESRLYRTTADFPRDSGASVKTPADASADLVEKQKAAWRDFLPSPRAGLRATLEEPSALVRSKKNTIANVDHELCRQREALDFVYYCVFNADPKIRTAFANFAASISKQPPSETIFKKCFGVGYEAYHENMYAFYRSLAQRDPDFKNNPWGAPAITVAHYTSKEIPKPIVFRNAKRSETSLMISDWFALCKAGDLARQNLLKADKESAQAHNDPTFKTALALNEAEHGDKLKAIALLENVAATNTPRARVYCTLAALLLEEIFEVKGKDYRLAPTDVRSVIEPLVTALKLPEPPLRAYMQFAAIWKCTDSKPPKEYLEVIVAGCRKFPDEIDLLESALPVLKENGFELAARQLAAESERCILSDAERQRLDGLRK